MAHQAEQINRYNGDYGQFTLKVVTDGVASRIFAAKKNKKAEVLLTYHGYEQHTCRFYFGSDSGITINGAVCPTVCENGISRVSLPLDTETEGLFFFHFELEQNGCLTFLSPDGITDRFAGEWQLLVCNDRYPSEYGFSGGAIYHIFVDRFAKGGDYPPRSDAIMLDWEKDTPEYAEKPGDFLRNNTFFGGTLTGIADKLDYISSLGVDLIYLSPVFTAYSNHKYDTGDYMSVDPMFGGDEALKTLIDGCHKRGIRIILDGVFNHVGDDSIYFDSGNKYGGALHNPSSPYREWFNISPDGGYECWWGVKNLPKVIKCDSFRSYICDTVIPKYMKMGIDGWRLDVVDEYPESFLERITSASKSIDRNAYILGEVWEDASNKIAYGERKKYLCGNALDGVMNYPFRNAVCDFITTSDNEFITDITTTIAAHYPADRLNNSMNMLGTHDTERILTVLGGIPSDGLSNAALAHTIMTDEQYATAKKRFTAAYALLAALPGKTAIYYGDEAGMQGYGDPFNRRPFPWGKEDTGLTDFVRAVNLSKKSCPALIYGDFDPIPTESGVFAFRRTCENETVSCVSNMTNEPYLLPAPAFSLTDGMTACNVPAGQTKILKGDLFNDKAAKRP